MTLFKYVFKKFVPIPKVLEYNSFAFIGAHPDDIDKVADKLAIELVNINPEIIFTIDNHVKSEIHPDHLKVGRASELAFFRCSFPLLMQDLGLSNVANPKGLSYYFTDCPNTFINVSKTFNQKILSISQHKSQFLSGANGVASIDNLIAYNKFTGIRYGLRKFCKYAEGFRVLSNTHLHCMPESSKF